jgi:osmotically-inducible protein OsmY
MSSINSNVVSRVTNALLSDPRTKGAIIEVSSQGGTVTLLGTVPVPETRQAAEEIARQQEGVVNVVNGLTISK